MKKDQAPTETENIGMAVNETAMNKREWAWLLLLTLALLVTYLSPLKEHLTHFQVIKRDLEQFGPSAPLVFIIAMSGLSAIGIPRMVMYPIAGLAFGFYAGLAWSLIATLIGAYATFLYARWAGRGLVLKKWPALARISSKLDGSGFLSVALIRQLPSPGFLTNLLFGISSVRTRCFLLGTALGSIPSAIPATLLGSSLSHASHEQRILYVVVSIGVLAALWGVASIYMKSRAAAKPVAAVQAADPVA